MPIACLVGGVGAGTALLVAAPPPATAWHTVTAAASAADPTAPLLAVLTLTAQLLLGWLALTAALCLLERRPGAGGRAAGRVAGRVAPAALRRVVAVGLGVAVAAGPTAPALAAGSSQGSAATAPLSLDWPGARQSKGDLDWPTAPAPPPSVRGAPAGHEEPDGAVVVRRGDTLWALAESSLQQPSRAAPTTAAVAAAWPSWWAANRDVIGDDPDLLLPGSVLRPPPDAAPPG